MLSQDPGRSTLAYPSDFSKWGDLVSTYVLIALVHGLYYDTH